MAQKLLFSATLTYDPEVIKKLALMFPVLFTTDTTTTAASELSSTGLLHAILCSFDVSGTTTRFVLPSTLKEYFVPCEDEQRVGPCGTLALRSVFAAPPHVPSHQHRPPPRHACFCVLAGAHAPVCIFLWLRWCLMACQPVCAAAGSWCPQRRGNIIAIRLPAPAAPPRLMHTLVIATLLMPQVQNTRDPSAHLLRCAFARH